MSGLLTLETKTYLSLVRPPYICDRSIMYRYVKFIPEFYEKNSLTASAENTNPIRSERHAAANTEG